MPDAMDTAKQRVLNLDHIPGGLWFPDCYDRMLNYFASINKLQHRRAQMVEVGTCHGKSAVYLLTQARERGIDVDLTCVDNFCWSPVGIKGEALMREWEKNLSEAGVSATCMNIASPGAAKWFEDGSLDAVFIDADHEYQPVLADIRAWWPKLRASGIMTGDDYNMAGVKRAVQETGDYSLGEGWRSDPQYTGPWPYWMRVHE